MKNQYGLAVLAAQHEEERESFSSEYSEIVEVIDTILFVSKGYVSLLIYTASEQLSSNLIMLIPRFQSYFDQSILLSIEGRIDEAYALLRMSTEVMRDIFKLLMNGEEAEKIYSNRLVDDKKYRNRFKFRKDHGPSELAFQIYSISSKFGIHGHYMTAMNSTHEVDTINSPHGVFFALKMTNLGKMESIVMWLRAFFPLYSMLIDGINNGIKNQTDAIIHMEQTLRETIENTNIVVIELTKSLKAQFDIEV